MAESQQKNTREFVAEILLIILAITVLFINTEFIVIGDGQVRLDMILDLLNEGKITNGKYSIIGPAFSIPLYFLGKIFKFPIWWLGRYNFFLFIIGIFFIYQFSRRRIDNKILYKFLLILITASMFANHVKYNNGELFTAIFVTLGIMLLSYNKGLLAWPLIVLGVVNTPASVVGFSLVTVRYSVKRKRWRYFLAIIVVVAIILAESYLRRGGLFLTGYENDHGVKTFMPFSGSPGFSYPFFFGLLSIIFSFGKGIIFFAPGLLLAPRMMKVKNEELRECYVMWIYFLVGMILVYAKWWAWYGGWFWGPRLFLFASIPASMALAVCLYQRSESLAGKLVTVGILTLSFWVGINGAVFGSGALAIWARKVGKTFEFLCWYVPEFSVLWRPFVVPKYLTFKNIIITSCFTLVYLYLAVPIYYQILLQCRDHVNTFKDKYMPLSSWKY
ncbi:MAG: hypothetical protein PVF76_09585 [Syntrophobacterales bacterium]